MKQKKRAAMRRAVSAVLLVLIATVFFTASTVHAANDDWEMRLEVSKVGTAATGSAGFVPFDQMQVTAKVTYDDVPCSNVLISFKVQGPANSDNPDNVVNITMVEETDAKGVAGFSWRVPLFNQDVNSVGSWQVTATAQTTEGSIKQELTFDVDFDVEISSITFLDVEEQERTEFIQGENVTAVMDLVNNGQPDTVTVTMSVQDASGNVTSVIEFEELVVNASSNRLQAFFMVPENAALGEATVKASVQSDKYRDKTQVSENKTVHFTITSETFIPSDTTEPAESTTTLFTWLLVSTGFFTFTTFYMFLKRKIMIFSPRNPSMSPPEIDQGQFQSGYQTTATDNSQTVVPMDSISRADALNDLYKGLELYREPTSQTIPGRLNRISNVASRIQTLKSVLKLEKEQLVMDLAELSRKVGEQESDLNNIETIKLEIEKLSRMLKEEPNQHHD
ncbi:MAG: hypothetical protein NWF04_01045 [Candidatus Bathyarchaeota archaeon]|nr:hypothetical protein [Candidatus Bathyarchaeota archaeon]